MNNVDIDINPHTKSVFNDLWETLKVSMKIHCLEHKDNPKVLSQIAAAAISSFFVDVISSTIAKKSIDDLLQLVTLETKKRIDTLDE